MQRLSVLVFLIIVAISCTVLKKSDPEQEVRSFVQSFQGSLTSPDEQILKYFEGAQSPQIILSVIKILQNKDQFVTCLPDFAGSRVTMDQNSIRVDVPVVLKFKDDESEDNSSEVIFAMWLKAKDKSYVISKLEGEPLYQAFTTLKNNNEWAIERKLAMQERLWAYEKARELEQRFDTVVWYTTYSNTNYFYVVEGTWENFFLSYQTRDEKNVNAKMGLVNAQGEIIIPFEYDLIGTLSFDKASIVEVRKDGRTGYFDIEARKLVVPPDYDMIIPYETYETLVKRDTAYGWLDKDWQYHAGLPNDRARSWVTNFGYLKGTFTFDRNTSAYCEIPSEDHAGFGILIPPAYLVRTGLFPEIKGGVSTTKIPLNGWTEYVKTDGSILEKITDNVSALVTAITTRYIEGREEFYQENHIVFFNANQDTLGMVDLTGGELKIRNIDSTLVEVVTPSGWEDYVDADVDELPIHAYFLLGENHISRLKSARLFPQTQFVKLDSTYLAEKHFRYNSTTEMREEAVGVSLKTLYYMRNEILATYKYRFKPEDNASPLFESNGDYDAKYDSIEEFEDQLTEIDRHNLAFLEKMISLMQQKAV